MVYIVGLIGKVTSIQYHLCKTSQMICIDFCMNGTFTFDGVASSGFLVICIDMNNRYLSKAFWRRYSAAKLSMLHFDSAGWGKLSFLVSHRCKWFKKRKTQRRI